MKRKSDTDSEVNLNMVWKVEDDKNSSSPIIILKSPDELTTATIHLFGATVTSWKVNNCEQLLLSNTAILDGSKAIRGGIPLVFPQFSQPLASMPQHGFARTSYWKRVDSESQIRTSDKAVLTLGLDVNESTRAVWPHEFSALYKVELTATSLKCTLEINNIDAAEFQCHTLLHSYLRLPAISRLAVTGFHNLTYRDKLLSNGEFVESDEIKLVASEVDRIYFAPSEAITLHIINENDESMKTPFLEISKSASLSSVRKSEGEEQVGDIKVLPCDVVFWNPWIEKSLTMADLDNEAYLNFVCVEPGTVRDWVTVPPQTKLKLSQTLTAV